VQHYTQFLAEALSSNRLKLSKPIKRRVTYHDPCFLSKRNRIYDEPRQILQSINGIELIEMRRNRENSFCCGGGAGRFWTEEAQPEKRPSVSRIKEALELGVDTIAVSCPFCVAMLEDAAKVLDVENKISIKDISELVVEAL
jgi:Fe-S oxidoreductase